MLLRDSLYFIDSVTEADGGYDYAIHLDPGHFIYRAHFPGNPITPGVCILQMATELLSLAVDAPLEILSVKNVKFLQVLVPGVARDIVFRLRGITVADGEVKAQIQAAAGVDLIAKISTVCRIVK